jgi:RecA-family ATPase
VVIDPAVSFGVGESRVNDAEQGLIEAARRLKRMIGCSVLYVHHSGKQNARDKAKDQYAGRGGSAFADGSRMVLVLQNVSPDEWRAATGRDLEEGETGLTLARPKISYCAPQDEILICRSGYQFERTERIRTTEQMEQESADDRVFHFLTEQLGAGKYHTKSTLEAHDLSLSRAKIREAVDRLLASGRLTQQDWPAEEKSRRGGARTYLHPMASLGKYGDHRC